MNLVEMALAKIALENEKEEIINALKVFKCLYEFKGLNEFRIAELSGIDLIETLNSLYFLNDKNLISFEKGKYFIPDLMNSMNKLIDLKYENNEEKLRKEFIFA
jgi:transcription initiation factor IIE alpha subunit